jgi:hypothetical protein
VTRVFALRNDATGATYFERDVTRPCEEDQLAGDDVAMDRVVAAIAADC